jgi:hypothetical protein
MELACETVSRERLVQGVDTIGDVQCRSIERARRTVMPSLATSANDPSMAWMADGSPLNTRRRASSWSMLNSRFRLGSRRSTTRLTG